MPLDEDDIDFSRLSGADFEELCFDLLHRLGFHGLEWRRGGADQGRDIEAKLVVTNALVGVREESWFIECKNLAKGVSVGGLADKIAWADAERPEHFVIVTSTYVTASARQWLKEIRRSKSYQIHSLEGKQLKVLTLGFPDLVERYFLDHFRRLLQDAVRRWVFSEILPSPEELDVLSKNLITHKLDLASAAFLWISRRITTDRVDDWCEEHDVSINDRAIAEISERLVSKSVQSAVPLLADFESILALETCSRPFGHYKYRLENGALIGRDVGEVAENSLKHLEDEILETRLSFEITARLILGHAEKIFDGLYCYTYLPKNRVSLELLVYWDGRLQVRTRTIGVNEMFIEDQLRAVSFLSTRRAAANPATSAHSAPPGRGSAGR